MVVRGSFVTFVLEQLDYVCILHVLGNRASLSDSLQQLWQLVSHSITSVHVRRDPIGAWGFPSL